MTEPFDPESLIDEFRDEARDQVDRLDAALLALEREGRLEEQDRSDLLRVLHTLKGNAGMLGLSGIRDFVHVLENVFKGRPGDLPADAVERLFEAAAALRSAIDATRGGAGDERGAGVAGGAERALDAARRRLEEVDADAPASEPPRAEPAAGAAESGGAGDLVRVPFPKLDTLLSQVGELLAESDVLLQALGYAGVERSLVEQADAVRRRADALSESVMSLRLVPLGRVLSRFQSLVRRLARDQGKEARLVVEGESTEVDKSTADALAEPLLHLVRNAIDHGIRPPDERERQGKPRHGTIRIAAAQEGDRVRLSVEDDGSGLDLDAIRERAEAAGLIEAGDDLGDRELVALIFRPGFSTRSDVSTVSGQGVGLDVVRGSIRELRGDVDVERIGSGGTRFVLRLPLTVAVVPSLLFESGGQMLALPASHVGRTLRLERPEKAGDTDVVRDEEELLPVVDPDRLFRWEATPRGGFGVVIRHGGRGAVVSAARLVDQRDLVVKALPAFGGRTPAVSGVSVLPGGRVILLLDPAEVIELNGAGPGGGA